MNAQSILPLAAVEAARRRIATGLRVTPCHRAPALSDLLGISISLKRDDLQRTGSFKERGARNALLSLDEGVRARGVVAASAGNHALGLAYHGAQLGVSVTVVVPDSAPELKVARCRAFGATVIRQGESFEAAQRHAAELATTTGATLVHPFDDLAVIAGQGTMALEILEQASNFDTIVVPVGGGGLLAGIATVVKTVRPAVCVIAVEPDHAASFGGAYVHGAPATVPVLPTIADGLAVSRLGERTFAIAASLVDDVVTVREEEIMSAIALLARQGVVAEGAGAVGLAALLAGKVRTRAVVLPIGGRNIDPRRHAAIVASAPSEAPRPAFACAA
jgi:threonine dehydratase